MSTHTVKTRYEGLDFLRAISMLYIVGAWHLLAYTQALPWFFNGITVRVTVVALGVFVIISGYLIGARTRLTDWQSVKDFFIAKFLRIYAPFVMALILFWAVGLVGAKQAVMAMSLMSMFCAPSPPTLWFITMILVFYVMAVGVLWVGQTARSFLLCLGLVSSLFALVVMSLPSADERVLIYLPVFMAGLIAGRVPQAFQWLLRLSWVLWVPALLLSIEGPENVESTLVSSLLTLCSSCLILNFCLPNRPFFAAGWVAVVSHSSYFMYLLHRPILETAKEIYFPSEGYAQLIFLYAICLPLVFGSSRVAQRLYDEQLQPRLMRWLRPDRRL